MLTVPAPLRPVRIVVVLPVNIVPIPEAVMPVVLLFRLSVAMVLVMPARTAVVVPGTVQVLVAVALALAVLLTEFAIIL